MSKEKEYIEKAEENILHTYNRYQVVLDHGKGVRLYDVDGKEYLDFAAGIGVQSLGYGNPEYTEALKTQADKLTHISNLYYSVPMTEAAEKVRRASGTGKSIFYQQRHGGHRRGAEGGKKIFLYEVRAGKV